MSEICKVCGLPKEICVCGEIAREQQYIRIYTQKRKFGKLVTVVEVEGAKREELKELIKKLKSKLACGGTSKDGKIELQGDHRHKIKKSLIDMGFSPETIEIK